MYAGRIVEEGPVRAIFRDPQHPYTRGLLSSRPGGTHGERLRAIDGAAPTLGALPEGVPFIPAVPVASNGARRPSPPGYPVGPDHQSRCYLHDPADGAR